jgi:hypothetical protein
VKDSGSRRPGASKGGQGRCPPASSHGRVGHHCPRALELKRGSMLALRVTARPVDLHCRLPSYPHEHRAVHRAQSLKLMQDRGDRAGAGGGAVGGAFEQGGAPTV